MFSSAMSQLSSGKRINSAADDAAGYAISNKLQAQSTGLNQAQSNAQDGISLIQTATGGLQTTQTLLQRLRQLAVQSANDTNTSSDRQAIQSEGDQIAQEITQIATTTQFNTKNLLDGSAGATGTLESTGTDFTLTGNYNGSAFGTGNSPTINAGNLAASDLQGSPITYTFSLTTAGTAGTVGNAGTLMTGTDGTTSIGDGTNGIASYTNSTAFTGATQTGVIAGTYNLTIGGGTGSSTISVSSNDTFNDVVDKINAVSDQTGVSAQFTTGTTSGIQLTNNQAGSTETVSATGQAQLLRGLGLMAADSTAYLNSTSETAAETQVVTASAVGTDGVATLQSSAGGGGPIVTLKADGNDFSDSGSGFSYNLNGVQGLTDGTSAVFGVNTSGSINLQVGANANQNLTVSIGNMTASALGVASGTGAIDMTTAASANSAITTIDNAIQMVSTQAANLGAVQNRLTDAISNLQVGSENMTSAYSQITDVNMAQESTTLATAQILEQSSTAMLAQANQAPQGILKLFS
jgi:flagellin